MKTLLLALSMFTLVSCKDNIKGEVIIAKTFTQELNECNHINGFKTSQVYTLHLQGKDGGHSIEVKQYFWELASCGDSIFIYRKNIKLQKKHVKESKI